MEKKSIKNNYIYNLMYQLLCIAMPLITTPYLSRALGADGVGIFSYSNSIVTYFMIVAVLGTSTYAQREIAVSRDDKKRVSITFFEVLILRSITSVSILCLYIGMIFIVESEIRTILLVQGIYIISIIFDISWFFQGLEEFKQIILRNFTIKLINLAYIFLIVKSKEDLILYILGLAVFTLLGNMSVWFYLPKYIIKIDKNHIHPFHNIKTIIELFLPTVSIQVYTVLDKTMIGLFSNESFENGYYEQSEKIIKVCLAIITSLGVVVAPRVAYIYEKGDMDKVKEYIYKSYRFVWFLGIPICFGLTALSDMIVVWFLGDGFYKSSILIRIFSFLILAIGISNVTGVQYLIPVKKQNIYTLTVTIGAVVNLILNLYLIPRFFSIGAAIASVIAEITITAIQLTYVVRNSEKFSLAKILQPSVKYLIGGMMMFGVIELIKGNFEKTLFNTLILSAIGALVYMTGMVICKDEFVCKIVNIMKRK